MAKRTLTLEELSDKNLECHEIDHGWERRSDEHPLTNSSGEIINFIKVVQCFRCGMTRRGKVAVPSFRRIGNYQYEELEPGTYYIKKDKGEPRTTKDDIRAEVYRREQAALQELARQTAKKAPAKKATAKKAARGRPITRKTTTAKRSA